MRNGKAIFVESGIVCQNMRHAYLLEVGLMQILAYHETLVIVHHARIHVNSSSMINFFGPLDLHLLA